jgi:hypothetical protein
VKLRLKLYFLCCSGSVRNSPKKSGKQFGGNGTQKLDQKREEDKKKENKKKRSKVHTGRREGREAGEK